MTPNGFDLMLHPLDLGGDPSLLRFAQTDGWDLQVAQRLQGALGMGKALAQLPCQRGEKPAWTLRTHHG